LFNNVFLFFPIPHVQFGESVQLSNTMKHNLNQVSFALLSQIWNADVISVRAVGTVGASAAVIRQSIAFAVRSSRNRKLQIEYVWSFYVCLTTVQIYTKRALPIILYLCFI